MSTPTNAQLIKICESLVGGPPLDFRLYDSGTLVIIAPDGGKHVFGSDEWQNPSAPPSKPSATLPVPVDTASTPVSKPSDNKSSAKKPSAKKPSAKTP